MFKIAYSPIFQYKVPNNHRFPMQKYRLIPEQLLKEGIITADNFFAPRQLTEEEILTTHTAEYWNNLKNQTLGKKEARAIGFDMTPELVERGRFIAHATYECALYAKKYINECGISFSIAGGTHHSFSDHGEGFCVFNDVCIASNLMLQRGEATRILSVDLDVHQGNGNSSIMANEDRVFIFSMHGEKNYPFRKVPSDLDIELANDMEDKEYLNILNKTLPQLIIDFQPDMIFYQAGVDVLESDKLGKLSLTKSGCKRRDEIVLQLARDNSIPIAVVMGGGYSENIEDVVEAHCNTFKVAKEIYNI